jgi:hypothetical protein
VNALTPILTRIGTTLNLNISAAGVGNAGTTTTGVYLVNGGGATPFSTSQGSSTTATTVAYNSIGQYTQTDPRQSQIVNLKTVTFVPHYDDAQDRGYSMNVQADLVGPNLLLGFGASRAATLQTSASVGSGSVTQLFYQNLAHGAVDADGFPRFDVVNNFSLSGLSILSATIEGPDAAAFSSTQPFLSTLTGLSGEFNNTILFTPKHAGASNAELVLHTDADAASGSAGDVFRFSLSGTAILPGDYNNNGVVDAADYVVWRANKGTTNALQNDPAGGTIGQTQYDQWRSHFGLGSASGTGSGSVINLQTVPEPSSLTLFAFVAICSLLKCGRTRSCHRR